MKLQARLAEAEDTIEGLNSRCISLEKLKLRLLGEIDDLQLQVDASNQMAITLEKRAKNFDKVVAEWKAKVDDLTQQLEDSQRENRHFF
jgi:chromosome segregation ATPase